MTEAIEVVYPQTLHQTCIVHLIRADIIRFSEGQSGLCKELKPIYQAVDADAAERALERFRNTTMGKKYPAIIQIWERAWAQVIPFIQFAPEIRTQIYTINSIEALVPAQMLLLHIWALFNGIFLCGLDPEKLVDVVVFLHHLGGNDSLIEDLGLLRSHARENAVEGEC